MAFQPRKRSLKIYKTKKKLAKKIALSGLFCCSIGILAILVITIYYLKDLPRPEKFNEGIIAQSTKITDRTGEIILYEIAGEEKRTVVHFSIIPEHLKNAIVTSEDRDFYNHPGVNLKSILRAVFFDLKIGKKAQGASTISQQLIRNYFLTRKKTLKRKTQEAILALELERRYEKNQIFEWYLNLIPFGSNIYGVEAASQAFFGKTSSELTLAQSAVLTALIKAPSALSPYTGDIVKLLQQRNQILNDMEKLGYISEEENEEAKNETIIFQKRTHPIKAPHFIMMIKQYLEEKYGSEYLERAGLKIITTIDIELQEYGEALLKKKGEDLKTYKAYNTALAAINPKTGELLAMVGSKDYFAEPFPENCLPGVDCHFDPQTNVVLSQRQPGSAFKPIVYSLAFEQGFLPGTLVWDAPTEFNINCPTDGSGEEDQYGLKCYYPRNYTGKFLGLVSLRDSLAQSRNLPSIKTLYLVGLQNALVLAKQLGLTTLTREKDYGLALVLGGGEVKLLELTSVYGVFANDGIRNTLTFIKKIEDDNGNIIEQARPSTGLRIVSSQTARKINDILSDNSARAPMFGWNSSLYVSDNVASKTGTTQDNNDAWCLGYSPNLVAGVWVGNNDNLNMTKAAASAAAPIWKDFMIYALAKIPQENFLPYFQETCVTTMLCGIQPEENHSILYFLNQNDPQLNHWEYGVANYFEPWVLKGY